MGNVYMEADQVRFKNSTYRNVQEGLAAALEGGGGGGTTVVANPEGSATADLNKLQVGTTIYGIPSEAGDISYDNTSSALTAETVQAAIDEVATDLDSLTTIIGDSTAGLVKEVTDIQDLIPSGATSSNKLATASDIPDAVTGNPSGSATAGDLTKLQIGDDIYDVPSGGSGEVYSDTETVVGTWFGQPLYRKCVDIGALPNNTSKAVSVTTLSGITVRILRGHGLLTTGTGDKVSVPIPLTAQTATGSCSLAYNNTSNTIEIVSSSDRSNINGIAILDYTKDSENP